MSNYKNEKFENSLKEFKRWGKTFKNLFNSDTKVRSFAHSGDYYLELNKVQIRELSNIPFLGLSLHIYNEEQKDFNGVFGESKALTLMALFTNKIENFCLKNDVKCTKESLT
jgi:hypothetical protein